MPLRLSSPITDISGIGPAKAKLLTKLGITHVRDLIYTFPRKHEFFSDARAMKDLRIGERMIVHGTVISLKTEWGWRGRKRVLRIFADITDGTGTVHATWYNLRFLAEQLQPGRSLYLAGPVSAHPGAASGKPEFVMQTPVIEYSSEGRDRTHTAPITPVYSETAGVTSRFLRYHIKKVLPLIKALPDYIPEDIRARHHMIGIHEAIAEIHFPTLKERLEEAQRRLRFDELFFLQLSALVRKQTLQQKKVLSLPTDVSLQHFLQKLPYQLTKAQTRVLDEIVTDIRQTVPMNRLLQGDVGSGKSVVALAAAWLTLQAGFKCIYLAPTEILARQQAQSFAKYLGEDKVTLLIGATPPSEKKKIKEQLTQKSPLCVVGTHALLTDDITARDVALAIIDEQHRFGVTQRWTLVRSGALHQTTTPHLLSMTATPIPRTLSLTVYGDLDISVLDEMPPGRKAIQTNVILPSEREKTLLFILEQIHAGSQVYVIAPLVETSPKLQLKSAVETFKEMEHFFPGVAVGLVHGQMKSHEKQVVMRHFAAGAIQLLVSTAVIEVGVDVPNATCMIIEGAERFGLAQLHQFRGRIGRGDKQSYCFLFPTTEEVSKSPRLSILASTNDGFTIAEADLTLRGPGEAYGVEQAGFSDLKVASLLDYETISIARTEAKQLLAADPQLTKHSVLQKKVAQKNAVIHFE